MNIKLAFCICEKKGADQLRNDLCLVVQFLYFQTLKFQASIHLLWLYSPVCVGPGLTPPQNRFSHDTAHPVNIIVYSIQTLQLSLVERKPCLIEAWGDHRFSSTLSVRQEVTSLSLKAVKETNIQNVTMV